MSGVKNKAKESKGKPKVVPKLKTILANPNKTECPTLNEQEMDHLKYLLQSAIKESNVPPRSFATKKGICLGLESSLRNINNKSSSCIFISLSIKPNHIISLIARNADTKDELQPVYAQPKLEKFVQEIFGIQALCMVFPKNLEAISSEIYTWVVAHRRPAKSKVLQLTIKKTYKMARTLEKGKPEVQSILEEKKKPASDVKSGSDDFMSFGSVIQRGQNSNLEGCEAITALSDIIDKIPKSKNAMHIGQRIESMEVGSDNEQNASKNNVEADNSDHSDYFLDNYKNLTVHKIKGNPNKKPKKKRKKNNKTN